MIDLDATRENFTKTGRKFQAYAYAKGFNPAHWNQKMLGRVRFTAPELEAMREDGLLVEMEEAHENA